MARRQESQIKINLKKSSLEESALRLVQRSSQVYFQN